jgi:hypothetical protein
MIAEYPASLMQKWGQPRQIQVIMTELKIVAA